MWAALAAMIGACLAPDSNLTGPLQGLMPYGLHAGSSCKKMSYCMRTSWAMMSASPGTFWTKPMIASSLWMTPTIRAFPRSALDVYRPSSKSSTRSLEIHRSCLNASTDQWMSLAQSSSMLQQLRCGPLEYRHIGVHLYCVYIHTLCIHRYIHTLCIHMSVPTCIHACIHTCVQKTLCDKHAIASSPCSHTWFWLCAAHK